MKHPRIGHGIDVHRFGDGNSVTLAGVSIPYSQGLVAHSDGDVALHALCDALLGALALGDIGKHFPDADTAYKNMDSRILLRHVVDLIHNKGYCVGNCDITVLAERPKLSPYISLMQTRVAEDLAVAVDCVGIKATTTEKLGFVGRQEGIEAHAVVLLIPR